MAAPSELRVLEHGVEHGQHGHVALHQPASVKGHPLRICNLYCRTHLKKVKTDVSLEFSFTEVYKVHWMTSSCIHRLWVPLLQDVNSTTLQSTIGIFSPYNTFLLQNK